MKKNAIKSNDTLLCPECGTELWTLTADVDHPALFYCPKFACENEDVYDEEGNSISNVGCECDKCRRRR